MLLQHCAARDTSLQTTSSRWQQASFLAWPQRSFGCYACPPGCLPALGVSQRQPFPCLLHCSLPLLLPSPQPRDGPVVAAPTARLRLSMLTAWVGPGKLPGWAGSKEGWIIVHRWLAQQVQEKQQAAGGKKAAHSLAWPWAQQQEQLPMAHPGGGKSSQPSATMGGQGLVAC